MILQEDVLHALDPKGNLIHKKSIGLAEGMRFSVDIRESASVLGNMGICLFT